MLLPAVARAHPMVLGARCLLRLLPWSLLRPTLRPLQCIAAAMVLRRVEQLFHRRHARNNVASHAMRALRRRHGAAPMGRRAAETQPLQNSVPTLALLVLAGEAEALVDMTHVIYARSATPAKRCGLQAGRLHELQPGHCGPVLLKQRYSLQRGRTTMRWHQCLMQPMATATP